jgi:hypothetical protein
LHQCPIYFRNGVPSVWFGRPFEELGLNPQSIHHDLSLEIDFTRGPYFGVHIPLFSEADGTYRGARTTALPTGTVTNLEPAYSIGISAIRNPDAALLKVVQPTNP